MQIGVEEAPGGDSLPRALMTDALDKPKEHPEGSSCNMEGEGDTGQGDAC